MYETRQPITKANFETHVRANCALAAAGLPPIRASRRPTLKELRGVPLRTAMTDRIIEFGEGCGPKDLLSWFTQEQIDQEHVKAFENAIRLSQVN